MSDTDSDSTGTPQGEELSEDQTNVVAGGGLWDDLCATAEWLEEQAKRKAQELMDLAHGQ